MHDSGRDAQEWVEAHLPLVQEVYQHFLREAQWPRVERLQRWADRSGLTLDVQRAADADPRVQGEARPIHVDVLSLRLRHLKHVPEAQPLVGICVLAFKAATAAYLSDEEKPAVRSQDLMKNYLFDRTGALTKLAYDVLRAEHPSPFGSSGKGDDGSWSMDVDSRFVRYFRNVESIDDVVAQQDEARSEIAADHDAYLGGLLNSAFDTTATVLAPLMSMAPDSDSVSARPLLFLSWSKPISKQIAQSLVPVLETRLPGVDVFFSPISIEPGQHPQRRMFEESLLRCDALVVVLTDEGAGSPYVIWETAAAWGRKTLVLPIFVDIEPALVPGPLTTVVQGVHLHDKEDLDRGLTTLAQHFGIEPPPGLSEDEHRSLSPGLARTGGTAGRTSWETRDGPVLKALADSEGMTPNTEHLASTTGLTAAEIAQALQALKDADMITGVFAESLYVLGAVPTGPVRLLSAGRQALHEWPHFG